MPTPTTWPSAKQFIGTAKEVTQGTAVVPITFTHPVTAFEPEDQFNYLADEALRGSMVKTYGEIQGVGHGEFSVNGPAFLDGLGFWLNNILGDLTTTGASAPFSHAISTLNSGTGQPGSLTIVDWQGTPTNLGRQIPGACLSELTIKGNPESGLIEWSGKGMAWLSAITAAAPVSAPTATGIPMAAWRTKIGIAGPASGGTQVLTIGPWEVTISRVLSVEHTAQNSQQPYIIQRGEVTVTGSLGFIKPSDEAALNYMLNNTQPQVQILASNGLTLGNALSLQIDMQNCAFLTSKINRGEPAVGYDDTFEAVANTTNAGASAGYSPIKVTLQNALPAGTY